MNGDRDAAMQVLKLYGYTEIAREVRKGPTISAREQPTSVISLGKSIWPVGLRPRNESELLELPAMPDRVLLATALRCRGCTKSKTPDGSAVPQPMREAARAERR